MTKSLRSLFLAAALSGALLGCGDDDGPPDMADAGPDAADTSTPDPDRLELPGLDGAVEVVYDDRGVPHIYATTRHDLMLVQGYLMSRDRFAQMEFIRRSVLGRIAEVAGSSSLEDDVDARWEGYRRMGREIYASLPADDTTRLMAEAFVEGINLYISRIRTREEAPVVRGAEVLNVVLVSPNFGPWEPADIFALARFQSANLSFDPRDDLNRSRRLAAILEAFPADSSDPRLAARAGFFDDMFGERPARDAFTRDGFNDGSTHAFVPPPGPSAPRFVPNVRAIDGAMPFLDRLEARSARIFGDLVTRGSNNWAVTGEHTASGNPILSNDPHLSLISPSVWWYVHLNTERLGGEDAIDVQGVAFAGLPGVVIGYNRDIAWGVTTTGYDVTDAYEEQGQGTCDADGNVASGTVLFDGEQRPIAFHEERVEVSGADAVELRLPYPAHRPGSMFLPGSCVPGEDGAFTAISVRYTGWEPSNELRAFTDLATARNAEEGRAALDAFEVGSQNFVIVDRERILWSTQSRIPLRDARARDLRIGDDGIPTGHCPHMLLPGTGEYEWTGNLDESLIPHEIDPARGWVATANQDNVGTTQDGNPCRDVATDMLSPYIGAGFDYGWRQGRILERLEALVTRGDITPEDMIRLQAETQSPLGRSLRDALVAALEAPRTHVPSLTDADVALLTEARARLSAWSFETPHGIGATDATEIADSIATTVFNGALTRILPLAFGDEMEAIGMGGPNAESARLLEWAVLSPERLTSYDAKLGDTVLWDDLRTSAEVETKAQILVRGVLAGMQYLSERLGSDVSAWRWGQLHTVRFSSVVPSLGSNDVLSIPASNDATYPNGFPRHGDWGNVDPGNFGLWNTTNFGFGSGASQRMIVEMTADGPRAWNAIPGGQSIDPDSPHKADEAMLWIRNEQPPMYFSRTDIESHVERTLTVVDPNDD